MWQSRQEPLTIAHFRIAEGQCFFFSTPQLYYLPVVNANHGRQNGRLTVACCFLLAWPASGQAYNLLPEPASAADKW
jgi:hypothetical protein